MKDDRRGVRLSTALPVAFCFLDAAGGEGWGRLLDLSESGARVESRWPLHKGRELRMTLALSRNNLLMDLRATVARTLWEEGYYVAGLAFHESVDRGHLRAVLADLVRG